MKPSKYATLLDLANNANMSHKTLHKLCHEEWDELWKAWEATYNELAGRNGDCRNPTKAALDLWDIAVTLGQEDLTKNDWYSCVRALIQQLLQEVDAEATHHPRTPEEGVNEILARLPAVRYIVREFAREIFNRQMTDILRGLLGPVFDQWTFFPGR